MPPNAVRVVLIDQHAMVRQLFVHWMRAHLGLRVVGDAGTVREGILTLLREKPDLALFDWVLPDARGFDLVRAVGAQLPNTRWLCLTANEQSQLVREAVSLGVHGFVQKRGNLTTLRDAIFRVAAGGHYYCPFSANLLVEKMVEAGRAETTLTPRERRVLQCYARGETVDRIAAITGVSVRTVQHHLVLLKEKLGVHESAELVRFAIKHGYVPA
jgi:DNA-binding NarL/FixJ family response regulator